MVTWVGPLALVALVAIGIVIAVVGRRRTTEEEDTSGILRVVRVGAIVYGALVVIDTAVGVIGNLTSDVVQVALPTQQFWPVLPDGVEWTPASGATLVGGGFLEADALVEGLGMNVRTLLAAGVLIQGLTQLAVTAAVYLLATRLLAGEPFQPVMSRAISLTAAALIAGGLLWQVFFGLGEFIAARQVLEAGSWAWTEDLGLEDPSVLLPQPRLGLTIEFWPFLTGMALAAVAAAFRRGERLQRDTAGLV